MERGGKVVTGDKGAGMIIKTKSYAMRSKENAQDYRYFPEPDIPPIDIDDEWFNSIESSLPELAPEKKARYIKDFGLPEYDAT